MPARPALRAGGGVAFAALLALWTWKLVEPNPFPAVQAALSFWDWLPYAAAKSLHAGAYGFLTLFALWLARRAPWSRVAVAGMALHGVGTEVAQTYVPGRHGCIQDVLIDWSGVAAAALLWRWRGRR